MICTPVLSRSCLRALERGGCRWKSDRLSFFSLFIVIMGSAHDMKKASLCYVCDAFACVFVYAYAYSINRSGPVCANVINFLLSEFLALGVLPISNVAIFPNVIALASFSCVNQLFGSGRSPAHCHLTKTDGCVILSA
ncbi:hypothetical protein QBC35DRAFT_83957 [Podospora australis]|uniref:Uncharacterized protein n=1 Tax=Podospora australis TaxID=1536484 RepID=A0AAN6WKN8_9PEZI|nr:hypothetical protein QBC35DRAFT_83957 [Podospora australis]